MAEDFQWQATNPDVIVAAQRETAVYLNPYGQVVIRQEAAFDEEEDPVVVIDHAHLPTLIAKLREFADKAVDRVTTQEVLNG